MNSEFLCFSIKVYKQYFNFSSAHFLIFEDGTREPLHGHNYKVSVRGEVKILKNDMVFDFLRIKPIVRKACDSLDHKLLLPAQNSKLIIESEGENYLIIPPDRSRMSFPKTDILLLPLPNISAERLAFYLAQKIDSHLWQSYQFRFQRLEVEVEETPGQSASFVLESF